jgi:hypothetical protein
VTKLTRIKKLPKHTKHLIRISIFIIAAIGVMVLRKFGYSTGFWGITGELTMSTIVDRLFPGGSFLGDVAE